MFPLGPGRFRGFTEVMNTLSMRHEGGAWRTLREAAGVLVRSPLGCVALGVAFLGVAGILRESSEFKKAEGERASWSRNVEQDLRDSLRAESAVRAVRVRLSKAALRSAREKALREEVGAALKQALAANRP